MSDIFISYASEDRSRAQMLSQNLERRGWSVFWDRTIPFGKTWRETIERELVNARCVIVLWSKTSIESGWVQEEADDAKRRGVLVPILIEKVQPPMGFRSIQAADLVGWSAAGPAPVFDRLLADIAALIGRLPKEAEETHAETGFEQKRETFERRSAQPGPKALRVFVNYRRDDSRGTIGRLYDWLERAFGPDSLLMDHVSFEKDFLVPSDKELRACDVFLAIIGPGWLHATDMAGQRALDSPDDFVTIEITVALARDIPVIPILVDGARLPTTSELPYRLKQLANRQAIEIRPTNFREDFEALLEAIRRVAPAR